MEHQRRGMVCYFLSWNEYINDQSIETLAEYNRRLQKLYHDTLAERLPQEEDLVNPMKRKHAMAKEVDWYKGMLAEFVQSAETSGKIKNNLKKMLKPVLKLVSVFFVESYSKD